MRQIHLGLFDNLKSICTDKTFNQTSLLAELRPTKGSSFHSIDLTAATDRFPVQVQRVLLEAYVGPVVADAWVELLTDRDYYLKGVPIRYGAGQPIGVLSSWAMFALSHHLVVHAAGLENNFPRFTNYVLLGDDIVIGNDQVALSYQRIMADLGCSFSEAKTHRSEDFFEFAKRWFNQGTEFTPFPLAGLAAVGNKYHLLYQFLLELKDRGFNLELSFSNPVMLTELLTIFGCKGRLILSILRSIEGLDVVPKGRNVDPEEAGVSAIALARLFGFTLPCRTHATLGKILSEHMRQAYG